MDGVHSGNHRIPAQIASKRSRRKPDDLVFPLRPRPRTQEFPGRRPRRRPPRFPAASRGGRTCRAPTPRAAAPSGMMALTWWTKSGKRRKPESTAVQAHRMMTLRRGPCPSRSSRWWMCSLSGVSKPCAPGRAPDEGEGHVDQGHAQDEQRDEERGEEEVGHARDRDVGRDPAADDHGRGGHEQAQEERAGVAHEDAGRVEVEGQEAETDAAGDGRHQRADVVAGQEAELHQAQPVDGQGATRRWRRPRPPVRRGRRSGSPRW